MRNITRLKSSSLKETSKSLKSPSFRPGSILIAALMTTTETFFSLVLQKICHQICCERFRNQLRGLEFHHSSFLFFENNLRDWSFNKIAFEAERGRQEQSEMGRKKKLSQNENHYIPMYWHTHSKPSIAQHVMMISESKSLWKHTKNEFISFHKRRFLTKIEGLS